MKTNLFKELHELHGMEFQNFMLERMVPVVGDITQHNIGIETDMDDILPKEVDIIFSLACTRNFDEMFLMKYGFIKPDDQFFSLYI